MKITSTTLSVRAKNALKSLEVYTIEECLNFDARLLFSTPNLGKKTVDEILSFIKTYKESNPSKKSIKSIYGKDITKKRFNYLSIVLAIPTKEITFPVRARHILSGLKINYLLDLVRKDEITIFERKNSGKKTLKDIEDVLDKFDLRLGMYIGRKLSRNVKANIAKQTDGFDYLALFKRKYPDKAQVFRSIKEKTLSKEKIDKFKEFQDLYKKLGTLEKVGKELGITRERVRQILKKGSENKVIEYTPRYYPYIPQKEIEEAVIEFCTLKKIGDKLKITPVYLKRLFASYGINKKRYDDLVLQGKKRRTINSYLEIKEYLGHDPSTTELQSRSDWRYVEIQIRNLWESIIKFREELDIPPHPTFFESVKPWIEHRTQIALIKRMQDMDSIRDLLASSPPLSSGQIARSCGVTLPRAHKLANMLVSTGEVIREGYNSTTRYRIAN